MQLGLLFGVQGELLLVEPLLVLRVMEEEEERLVLLLLLLLLDVDMRVDLV